MKLLTCECICGCGKTFKTTRATDRYASQVCEELHTRNHSVLQQRRYVRKLSEREAIVQTLAENSSPLRLDPLVWISASELAMRLLTHASTITKLTQEGLIPYNDSHAGMRRYNFKDVVKAIELFNSSNGHRKLLTKYFRSR